MCVYFFGYLFASQIKRQNCRDIRPKFYTKSLCLKSLGHIKKLKIFYMLYVYNKINKIKNSTLSGGSLGLWVDEERSKLRVDM